MAELIITLTQRRSWSLDDRLELMVGSENAATLNSSDPPGGRVVWRGSPWPDGGQLRGGFGRGEFGRYRFGAGPVGVPFGRGRFGRGEIGWSMRGPLAIEHTYHANDVCATLPIGVRVIDQAGNISEAVEQLVRIADPPRGARNVTVTPGQGPGQALIAWRQSRDLTPT